MLESPTLQERLKVLKCEAERDFHDIMERHKNSWGLDTFPSLTNQSLEDKEIFDRGENLAVARQNQTKQIPMVISN